VSKIVFTAFGTAGDILPCVPVASALRERGHDVTFLTPRWLGLYCRSAGFRTMSVGDGSERRALTDFEMYTNRFDGMASWRRSLADYLYPLVSEYYQTCLALTKRLQPDLIVTTAQGFWGSLAAVELGIPWVSLHLYPQLYEIHQRSAGRKRSSMFGGPLANWLIDQEHRLKLPASAVPALRWGISSTRTVGPHDPSVMNLGAGMKMLGFPYWDSVFPVRAELDDAISFLQAAPNFKVVVSLGSFIGLIDSDFWESIASCASHVDGRFLLVGLPDEERRTLSSSNVRCLGHVPLSSVLSDVDLFIHHGGIGSTYAGLLMGVPSLVAPHAFDQTYNARVVAKLGVGRTLPKGSAEIGEAVGSIMSDARWRDAARGLAAKLIRPEIASISIAAELLGGVEAPS
jgi:rhamnosyltransferase subunit B